MIIKVGLNLVLWRIKTVRLVGVLAVLLFVVSIIAVALPFCYEQTLTSAASGASVESVLNFTSTNNAASVTLGINSSTGTFATSLADQKASFSISTNNYTGYTVKIATNENNSALSSGSNSIESISSVTTATDFLNNASLNNKWGYIPNYYNSEANTSNYYPAPTSSNAATLRVTDAPNSNDGISNADNYTIGLGLRADYSSPSGTYTNNTFVIQYIANPVAYSIAFGNDTGDTVTNLPTALAGTTNVTSVTLTNNTTPTRTGYTFANKWCLGSTANNGTTCSGTEYAVGSSFGIDQTIANSSTLYAMWTPNTYPLAITFAGIGGSVSSVKVCVVSGDCTGADLKGTVSASGGSVSDLAYGVSYYLYPTFSSNNYGLASWEKTSSYGALNGETAINTTTTTTNPTFTIGLDNAITIDGQKTINAIQYMQEITSDNKFTVLSSMTEGNSYTLYDKRDSKAYRVAKLADGNLWMLDNLALDLTALTQAELYGTGDDAGKLTNASDTTLGYLKNGGGSSPYTTNVVTNWVTADYYNRAFIAVSSTTTNRLCYNAYCVNDPSSGQWSYDSVTSATINGVTSIAQGKIGVYYNYCAASAGSYCYSSSSSSGNLAEDICPAGWHIPDALNTSDVDAKGYMTLYSSYSNGSPSQVGAFQTALSTPLSGYFYSGKAYQQGYKGHFWSSTRYDNAPMSTIVVDASTVTESNLGRDRGASVRCMVNL